MIHLHGYRLCLGWAAAITLAAESIAAVAQTTTTLPKPPMSVPQFQPTPEEIGDSFMAHQRYQAAIEAYKKSGPSSADAWNKMGVAYQLMYNIADAEHCYEMALKLDPKNATAVNNLGSVYMAQKDYSKAQRAYRKALKLNPKSALFHKNLGTAFLAARKYKQGWESYQQALSLDQNIFDHSSSVRVENPASIQDRGAMNFYMAKGCVKAGMNTLAVQYLRLALNEGFTTPKKIMSDAEFAGLRNFPAFQQLLASEGVYLTPITAHPAEQP